MRIEARDALLSALQANYAVAALVSHFSKKLEHWNDVPKTKKPMITVVAGKSSNPNAGWQKPVYWELDFWLYVYVDTGAADGSAQDLRDMILDAVTAALLVQPVIGRQSLGGQVHDCRISGTIETDEGATGQHGIAWVPITIRPL